LAGCSDPVAPTALSASVRADAFEEYGFADSDAIWNDDFAGLSAGHRQHCRAGISNTTSASMPRAAMPDVGYRLLVLPARQHIRTEDAGHFRLFAAAVGSTSAVAPETIEQRYRRLFGPHHDGVSA
jgi:hypothetical protein